MALKGRYSYLYGLQTDALAKDSKANGVEKGGTESCGAETTSEIGVNGGSKHDSAEELNSAPHAEATTSHQNGDISSISHKIDIQVPNGTSI